MLCLSHQRAGALHLGVASTRSTPTRLCVQAKAAVECNQKVVYRDSAGAEVTYQQVTELPHHQVAALLERVGWPPRNKSRMEEAVRNSFYVASLETQSQADELRLVGLARVVSDGAYFAEIWDVVIDPDYQGLGLGKTMIEEVIRHLDAKGISNISTFAHENGLKFYEKLGFQCGSNNVKGMFYRQLH